MEIAIGGKGYVFSRPNSGRDQQGFSSVWSRPATDAPLMLTSSPVLRRPFSNLSRPTPVRTILVDLSFGCGDAPFHVKQVLLELARETPGVLADRATGSRE